MVVDNHDMAVVAAVVEAVVAAADQALALVPVAFEPVDLQAEPQFEMHSNSEPAVDSVDVESVGQLDVGPHLEVDFAEAKVEDAIKKS